MVAEQLVREVSLDPDNLSEKDELIKSTILHLVLMLSQDARKHI